MTRVLLDTNIFVYYVDERDMLSYDVMAILVDCDTQLCMSAESVKELIVGYRAKKLLAHKWKSVRELVQSIKRDYNITVLPVDYNVTKRMSDLQLNEAEDHNDPSDHIIISHALVLKMPLISSDRKFSFYTKQGLRFIFNKK